LGADIRINVTNELLPPSLFCREPVYHYTSAAGLLGTSQGHALWATEAFGLNDVAELRHGWAFIRSWLDAQDKEDGVIRDLLEWLPADDDPDLAIGVFMCCASTLPDDASQWRLYADAARGYAIELDPAKPLGVLARMEAFPGGKAPDSLNTFTSVIRDSVSVSPWLRVLYNDTEKNAALREFVESARQRLGKLEAASEKGSDPEEEIAYMHEDYTGQIGSGLATLAQCMKADAFSGESEVRAVATFGWGDDHSYFRSTGYGVVRYVNLVSAPGPGRPRVVLPPTSEAPRLPILSVRLGPAQVVQNSEGAAQALLKRYGYPQVVSGSSAALR
jgi:hypothetical protein